MQIMGVILFFALVQIMIWFSTNYQFMEGAKESSALLICAILAIPTSVAAFFACKNAYSVMESVWSVRLIAFGTSYLVFPILTWVLLNESPFAPKTVICIVLSFIIIGVQIFYPK